jgi:hypothetical protein
MTRSLIVAATLSLPLLACSETSIDATKVGVEPPGPDILVTPPELTFGTLALGEVETQSFTVENVGEATLQVRNVTIRSGLAFTVDTPEAQGGRLVAFDLEPGERREIPIAFTPMGADENVGEASVFSDDPDTVEARVGLVGFGTPPELRITPESHVFDGLQVPCDGEVELLLENVGAEDLEITDYAYEAGAMLSLDDSDLPPLPFVLPPGGSARVQVLFDATGPASDAGLFSVISNDPRGVVTADQSGESTYVAERTEAFTEPGVPPVDVMILIDQSCSMATDNSADVVSGFPDFVAQLQNVSDWQLALVTDYNDPDAGCATGGILTEQTANVSDYLVANAFPGTQPGLTYDTEALLRLADTALSKARPGGCNFGFLRPGALLHIILMSDETDQSGQSGAAWVNQYQPYVASPSLVRVSGVLDLFSACGDGTGPGAYLDAVNLTGGSALDICVPGWGQQLSDIAEDAVAGIRTYNLSDLPDPASVEVTVNGNPTVGFTVFGDDVTIQSPPVAQGDLVEISYAVLAECD